MNQVRIISELEKEKKKMQEDVSKLKEAKVTYFTQAVDLFFLLSLQRTFWNTVRLLFLFTFFSKTALR